MSQDRGKKYWKAPDLATSTTQAVSPNEGDPGDGVGRRKFLQLVGFTIGATTVAGCSQGKENGVMPYLIRPEEVTPGKAYWYASVCGACPAGCGVLAKAREGRPIKLEGNPLHPVSAGGLCAAGQASVLGLYDSLRLLKPLSGGRETGWAEVDREMGSMLETLRASGGRVRFLTDSGTGPAESEMIETFLARFEDGRHVTYDPISTSAIADAHRDTHGARILPRYRFANATVIVSLGADFLGTWISPVEHTAGYRSGRSLEGETRAFSYHVQFESRMSLTGSNADRRIAIPPGTSSQILAHLAQELARRGGTRPPWASLPDGPVDKGVITAVADRLWSAPRGKTLVVCGDNDVEAQRLTNLVNHTLGNYGPASQEVTVDLLGGSVQRRGDDAALGVLLQEIRDGAVDALFVRGVNPVYDLPDREGLERALERVKLVVSFAGHEDETSRHAHFICPEPHYLESWGDSESLAGIAAVRQPTIRPLGSTRPLLESLAAWSGSPASARDLVRDFWRRNVYPRRESYSVFEAFWNKTLHDGAVTVNRSGDFGAPASHDLDSASITAPGVRSEAGNGELLVELHPSTQVMDGRHALNPWLHEMPEPIAKTVWDNFAAISPAVAQRLGVADGEVLRISTGAGGEASIELPAFVQPGQHPSSVAIALGYGRQGTQRFTEVGPRWWEGSPTVEEGGLVGANAAPLIGWAGGTLSYSGRPVRVEKAGRRHELATTQIHHTLTVPDHLAVAEGERRPIVSETTLAAWREDPASGVHEHGTLATLWEEHPMSPHHWGLAIDLTACTGCSACVVSCQAENNVPVVGKDEVRRAREMHWMRIDRYYGGEGSNVDVVHMPMLCQHCDNAPCETVCPVQATAQSAEGLNQQVYNRCVGTRYCANNCPYKVRRFNWFDYPREDTLQNLALNPDVTVRSRGVMEKCSLCVQRIQNAKAEAKREGRGVRDGEILPACAQSCPAGAIVFGDMNNADSLLARQKKNPRHYLVLEETGVKPVVGYLSLVRNRDDSKRNPHR